MKNDYKSKLTLHTLQLNITHFHTTLKFFEIGNFHRVDINILCTLHKCGKLGRQVQGNLNNKIILTKLVQRLTRLFYEQEKKNLRS